VSRLLIVTFGECGAEFVDEARDAVAEELQLPVSVLDTRFDPAFAFEARRGQYNSGLLLKRLLGWRPEGVERLIGLIDADLFIPMLSFVYGQAQVGGPCALVGAARLRQEFYRMPPEMAIFRRRVRKEVLHEIGHTLTLVHCEDATCVMSLATGLPQVDRKSETYCPSCRLIALEHVAAGKGNAV
jgi:archaemetzincin